MDDFDWSKDYTEEDFDKMIIPVYNEDGYPYLDMFEYMDAMANNIAVERLREKYFFLKKWREKRKEGEH